MFVHTVHLLDLDLREDWPGLTEQFFDTKFAPSTRVKAVVWCLYRLFELYDGKQTTDVGLLEATYDVGY